MANKTEEEKEEEEVGGEEDEREGVGAHYFRSPPDGFNLCS